MAAANLGRGELIGGLTFGYILGIGLCIVPFTSCFDKSQEHRSPPVDHLSRVKEFFDTSFGRALMDASGALYNNKQIEGWIEENQNDLTHIEGYGENGNELYYNFLWNVVGIQMDPKILLGFSEGKAITQRQLRDRVKQYRLLLHPDHI